MASKHGGKKPTSKEQERLRKLFAESVQGTYFDAEHMKLNAPRGRSDGHEETSQRYLNETVKNARERLKKAARRPKR